MRVTMETTVMIELSSQEAILLHTYLVETIPQFTGAMPYTVGRLGFTAKRTKLR